MSKVGIYARYSNIDKLVGEDQESRSIKNQIDILTKYVNDHNLKLVRVYADYHKTGSNMDRPALQELLQDASEGKIDTIVVKDLSRFGRNYMEVGEYIEKIFPAFGIRFISVNDNYDSSLTKDDLSIAIKNYINHLYSKESSKKIRKAMALRAEKEPILTWKYGYNIKNKVITIDDYSANIVKEIFKLANDGLNLSQIANKLNEERILCPSEYRNQKLGRTIGEGLWKPISVSKILRDEAYTGTFTNLVQSKYLNNTFRTEHKVTIPKIIDKDYFDKTPKYYMHSDEESKYQNEHLLRLIRCADCEKIAESKKKFYHGFMSPKLINDEVKYVCYNCRCELDSCKIEEHIYKNLVIDLSKIASNKETYITKLSKELGAVEKINLDSNSINQQMKSLFERYLKGEISYKEYNDGQNNLTSYLINNEINKRNQKNTVLTTYALRNKVIRYLNSLDMKEADHLKFIKENVIEVYYSIKSGKSKFIYPFMKE